MQITNIDDFLCYDLVLVAISEAKSRQLSETNFGSRFGRFVFSKLQYFIDRV